MEEKRLLHIIEMAQQINDYALKEDVEDYTACVVSVDMTVVSVQCMDMNNSIVFQHPRNTISTVLEGVHNDTTWKRDDGLMLAEAYLAGVVEVINENS